jgi:2-amino-4-hydroxy-6-hydroxymethyldihydropteridine diphosphokinase
VVAAVRTGLKPRQLLDVCFEIERQLGRAGRDVWSPRRIDLDLIACDDFVIRSGRLTLPHPFAHSRPYVLGPLREIAPEAADWVVARSRDPR